MSAKPMTPEERDDFADDMDDLDRLEFVTFALAHPDEGFDAIAARMERVRANLATVARRAFGDNAKENS